jgi:hypothetical protein
VNRDPLDKLDRELSQIKAVQHSMSSTSESQRISAAVLRRSQLEANIAGTIDRIEAIQKEVIQLQTRQQKLVSAGAKPQRILQAAQLEREAKAAGQKPPVVELQRIDQDAAFLGGEIVKKLTEVDRLMERARCDSAHARPVIAWCRLVEGGMSEDAATRLQTLEAAETARAEQVVTPEATEMVDLDGANEET